MMPVALRDKTNSAAEEARHSVRRFTTSYQAPVAHQAAESKQFFFAKKNQKTFDY
jgi:hypothetical protein